MAVEKQSFSDKVATELIDQIKQGTAPWQKPWDGQDLQAPVNAITGKPYRGVNNLWLSMMQPSQDNRWLTYNQAESIGAQVRKGEKGTTVEYWKFEDEQIKKDKDGKEVLDDNGKPVKVRYKLERPKVFYATVFNAIQCDNMPPLPPKEELVKDWDIHQRAESILKNSGAIIEHQRGDRAFYRPSQDKIVLPEKEQFPTVGGYYGTALHELGHWTGHESRLNRDMAHPFGSEGYAKEELRAEIASLMLSQSIGVPFDPGHHAAYVDGWVSVLENDSREIFRAAADAEKIKDYVMAFERVQEREHVQSKTGELTSLDIELLQNEMGPMINQVDSGELLKLLEEEKEQITLEALKDMAVIVENMLPYSLTNPVWKERENLLDTLENFPDKVEKNLAALETVIAEKQAIQEAELKESNYQAYVEESHRIEKTFNSALSNGEIPDLVETHQRMELTTPNSMQKIELAMLKMMPFDIEDNPYWHNHQLPEGETLPEFIKKHNEGMIAIAEAKEELRLIREEEAVVLQLVMDNKLNDEVANLEVIGDTQGVDNIAEIVKRFEPKDQDNAFWRRHKLPAESGQLLLDAASSKFAPVEKMNSEKNNIEQDFDLSLDLNATEKQYFYAPYNDRKEVREAGGEWDKEKKSWYIPSGAEQGKFDKWLNSPVQQAAEKTPQYAEEKVFIDVPYAQRNEAKELGAKWDKDNKSWYVPEGVNIELFSKWTDNISSEQAEQKTETIEQPSQSQTKTIDVEDVANNVMQPKAVNDDKVYLAVPFKDKNEAKELGAKWDKDNKSWFTNTDNPNLEKLEKWLPKNQAVSDVGAITPQEEFANKMREMGLTVPNGHPIMDGQRHRVATVDDSGKATSGSYKAYLDGKPAGSIENFKTGEKQNWKFEGMSISPEEQATLRAEAAVKKQEREKEREQGYATAAAKAQETYNNLPSKIENLTPYLERKGISIESTIGMKTTEKGTNVTIPIKNVDGQIQSLQSIGADGTKYMMPGGKLEGGFHVINEQDLGKAKSIIIAEGVATAASIHESLQGESNKDEIAVVAAFNSNNLVAVTQAIHGKYPDAQKVIAADDDLATQMKEGKNPGKVKAAEAAALCGDKATVIAPVFMPGEQSPNSKDFTDFNDLHTKSQGGIKAVRQIVIAAVEENRPKLSDGVKTDDIKILAAKTETIKESVDATQKIEAKSVPVKNENEQAKRGKSRV